MSAEPERRWTAVSVPGSDLIALTFPLEQGQRVGTQKRMLPELAAVRLPLQQIPADQEANGIRDPLAVVLRPNGRDRRPFEGCRRKGPGRSRSLSASRGRSAGESARPAISSSASGRPSVRRAISLAAASCRSSTALDTSVIIAGLLTWHQDHARARAALETALAAPEPTILPVHALLEAYSVMTRLPPPRRLTPDKARTALSESLRDSTRLVGLDEEGWAVIEQLADRLIGGGMTYDASIVASARKAEATRILTLNGRHFERLAGDDMETWEPEEPPKEEAQKG